MKTTLNQIRKADACLDGWGRLLASLGKTTADDEELSLMTILESNGLSDALWVLENVIKGDASRQLARDYAEHVLNTYEKQYPNNSTLRDCIQAVSDNADPVTRAAAQADAALDAWAAADRAARVAAQAAARTAAWDPWAVCAAAARDARVAAQAAKADARTAAFVAAQTAAQTRASNATFAASFAADAWASEIAWQRQKLVEMIETCTPELHQTEREDEK